MTRLQRLSPRADRLKVRRMALQEPRSGPLITRAKKCLAHGVKLSLVHLKYVQAPDCSPLRGIIGLTMSTEVSELEAHGCFRSHPPGVLGRCRCDIPSVLVEWRSGIDDLRIDFVGPRLISNGFVVGRDGFNVRCHWATHLRVSEVDLSQ
jgi:hypothetical protein